MSLVTTVEIHATKEYGKFRLLEGNRVVDEKKVKRLMRLMEINGNLTKDWPVVINGNWEVMDGQHRIEALKRLKWEVFYEIKQDLTLQDVRAINVGHHNWSWLDYAESYSRLGNINYQRVLQLHDKFPSVQFSTLILFTGNSSKVVGTGKDAVNFRNGGLIITDVQYAATIARLEDYADAVEAAQYHGREFASAFYKIHQHENYDHERMITKLSKLGERVQSAPKGVESMLRVLESIFNYGITEENHKMLF